MTDPSIPSDFIDAACRDVLDAGYYCVNPEIEISVDDNYIKFLCKSKIITLKPDAYVDLPTAQAAKGLKLIEAKYEIDGQEIVGRRQITNGSCDQYSVTFERTRSAVKQISDEHYWLSPVTAYTVTTQHSRSHLCGIGKLVGSRYGFAPDPQLSEPQRNIFKYPCASFSGQGFRWWVKWKE